MLGDVFTERMPPIPLAAAAKSGELEVAVATPISGTVPVSVPPAAAIRSARPAGTELPLAMMRYCRAAVASWRGWARPASGVSAAFALLPGSAQAAGSYQRPCGNVRISSSWQDHRNRTPPSGEPGTDYAVGVGTDTGSTLAVPDPRTGRVQPRLDPQTGQPAVSRANESLMRSIATAGRGTFYNGNAEDAAAPLSQEIAALQRTRFASQEGSLPIERYQWFLAAGLALLVIEMLIPERRRRSREAARTARRNEGRRAA